MNTKAEKFKAYIDKVDPKAFMVDEIKDDERHSVAFRSGIEVKGQRLPFLVLIDDSIYVMLRIFVATQVVNDGNKAAIHDFINQGNKNTKYLNSTRRITAISYSISACPPAMMPLIHSSSML